MIGRQLLENTWSFKPLAESEIFKPGLHEQFLCDKFVANIFHRVVSITNSC